LNLTPDRIAGTELPAWVEQQLMRATGAEEAVARMAG
jgi:hypothetical protein